MHQTTGRWRLGLLLSLTTVSMWGVLPIVLKLLLAHMDAATITWYRFLIAALVVGVYLGATARFPAIGSLSTNARWLLLIAVVGLTGNYLLYLLSLNLVSPGTAQVVIQLAPIMLMAGGLLLFGERFERRQWIGVLILTSGMGLFFNDRLAEMFTGLGAYTSGVLMVVVASASWAAYALAQKQLLRHLKSNQIMFLLYCASMLLFWPWARPSAIFEINGFALGLLLLASVNTLVAYGAFAEALNHWQATRVSAILAITPLLTLSFAEIYSRSFPDRLASENLGALALTGAVLVVGGSIVTAMGGRRNNTKKMERGQADKVS
ncbi:MAG: DMT family transporter [Proteobacteria bacterium]|nr:DMT family transporter [Pseudomonadota bacterium]